MRQKSSQKKDGIGRYRRVNFLFPLTEFSLMSQECCIYGCNEPAEKELDRSVIPVIQALKLRLKDEKSPIKVCKKHYNMIKKARKGLT